jgi:anti-sigma B factor antagonist
MEISVRRTGPDGSVAVIDINGVIDSETVDEFDKAVNQVMKDGCYNIVLNLARMNYINTAGLSIIADTFKQAQQNKGALKILNATDTIKELLDVVRFTRIIELFEDESEAVSSFEQ